MWCAGAKEVRNGLTCVELGSVAECPYVTYPGMDLTSTIGALDVGPQCHLLILRK